MVSVDTVGEGGFPSVPWPVLLHPVYHLAPAWQHQWPASNSRMKSSVLLLQVLQVFLLLASPVNLHVLAWSTSSSLTAPASLTSTTAKPSVPPGRFRLPILSGWSEWKDGWMVWIPDQPDDFDRVKCDVCESSCHLHGIKNVKTFCNECRKSVGCSDLPNTPILKEVPTLQEVLRRLRNQAKGQSFGQEHLYIFSI